MKIFNFLRLVSFFGFSLILFSCSSLPPVKAPEKNLAPTRIMGEGMMDENRLVSFFMENNAKADSGKVHRMARYYIEEGKKEGVNSDVAFVQMCLETGFLSFGGAVTEDMNNFCGLGSLGNGTRGNSFPDERTGVRAHIQHLKGYATSQPLALELVDTRYRYIQPKGKAPTVYDLAGTWARDPSYGTKLEGLLVRLYS